jgi:hypothetical protein
MKERSNTAVAFHVDIWATATIAIIALLLHITVDLLSIAFTGKRPRRRVRWGTGEHLCRCGQMIGEYKHVCSGCGRPLPPLEDGVTMIFQFVVAIVFAVVAIWLYGAQGGRPGHSFVGGLVATFVVGCYRINKVSA